jgi:hypothetical protein
MLTSTKAKSMTNLQMPPKLDPAHDTPLCAPGPWWSSGNAAGRREGSGLPLAKATRVSGVLPPILLAAGSIP